MAEPTAPTMLSDFAGFITPEMSAPIFEDAARSSVVMQLVRQVPLGFQGKSIPMVTGRPTAAWVDEGARKPSTKGSRTLKTITPKKLAAIVVDSKEVVRANPGNYVSDMRGQLAEAFAIAFDNATLHDLGGDGTGTGPFTNNIDETSKSVELGTAAQGDGGVYADFNDALGTLIGDTDATGRHYKATGFALDDLVEPMMRGAVDTVGRPIWVDLPANEESNGLSRPGSLLGRRSFMGEGVGLANGDILGYVGDWTKAVWGVVGGISYDVSTQATVTIDGELVSLWENNLVAVLAEAEYGWAIADVEAFVKLANAVGS